jgi:hypothetical protein
MANIKVIIKASKSLKKDGNIKHGKTIHRYTAPMINNNGLQFPVFCPAKKINKALTSGYRYLQMQAQYND